MPARPVYHVETLLGGDAATDAILVARLNAIVNAGGVIISVTHISVHWTKIIWTS